MEEGMEPEIWFDPSDKYSNLLERLTIDIGRLPFRTFPFKDSFVSWVQFARDVRNDQSCASSKLLPKSNSCKFANEPRDGTEPCNELFERSSI
uniref:Uncharacterized protein n=1 Tax=Triticum urartu TaxID=4572 RepID=A0A8R7P9N7_TRIUA